MNQFEAVKMILASQGRSRRSLAIELGISSQALDHRLKSNTGIATLAETVEPLGYRVALVPAEGNGAAFDISGDRPPDA